MAPRSLIAPQTAIDTGEPTKFPFKCSPNSARVGCGYKDQCLKLADVRRNGIDQVVVIPCRRSHNYTRVVGDLD